MATLKATRTAQWPLVAEFTFSPTDSMTDVNGVSKQFGGEAVAETVFDVINLPRDAVVIGGEVITETAVGGATAYNVKVGDSGSATRYLGATDRVTAGRTALVPTGYRNTGGLNLRVSVAPTVAAATTGVVTVRVEYIIKDRSNEVQPS